MASRPRPGGVEGYRADKLLHEVADPGLVLAEARRVLAPGGRIVLLGQDWEGLIVDAGDPNLTRTLVHARARSLPSPRAARAFRALLLDHGFHDVEVTVHTALFTDSTMLPLVQGLAATGAASGAVDPDQARGCAADQVNRIREGTVPAGHAVVPGIRRSSLRTMNRAAGPRQTPQRVHSSRDTGGPLALRQARW